MNDKNTIVNDRDQLAYALANALKERDEALELLESEKITRNHIIKRTVEVEKERDEARQAFSELWQYADALLPEIDEETLNRWNKCLKLY